MDSSSSMNLDYMPIENNMTNGYGGDDNSDLNQIFESSQYGATSSNGMFAFGSGFTPNGMNIDGGMGGNFAPNAMFQAGSNQGQLEYQPQTSAFSFPQQQVDPSAIMRPNETQDSECSQESSEPSQQQGETGASKTKKTRRSKKKPLTKAQEEQKREEFLERNRVAASKCRKRKQEQTQNLQENHQRLQQDNYIMGQAIKELEAEVGRLRAILVGHRSSGVCQTPQMLDSQIDHYESTTKTGSLYGSPVVGSARPSSAHSYRVPMYRTSSAMSQLSISSSKLGYKGDGTPDLNSPWLPDTELKRLNKERLAKDEEYMKVYTMGRQNSNASNSSEVSGTSGATGNESGYTSAITSPEGEKPKEDTPPKTETKTPGRRGRPRKLEHPRGPRQGLSVDPALQNPVDYLAQQL